MLKSNRFFSETEALKQFSTLAESRHSEEHPYKNTSQSEQDPPPQVMLMFSVCVTVELHWALCHATTYTCQAAILISRARPKRPAKDGSVLIIHNDDGPCTKSLLQPSAQFSTTADVKSEQIYAEINKFNKISLKTNSVSYYWTTECKPGEKIYSHKSGCGK